jgi:uncharacterized protein (DUF58 family)
MIEAILQQVCHIPLPIHWLTQHTRLGQHQSRRRGEGMDFDQIKEYQAGESVRKFNWAATARRGGITPLVNTYYDEKAITVMLLVDLSASMDFGSTRLTKRSLAAEISASLVYSALASHDRVGLLGFASDVVCYLPPRRSWTYQRAIPEHLLAAQTGKGHVNFGVVVDHLEKWVKQPSLLFLLSDFLTDDTSDLSQALTQLRRRYDPIALMITDPLEITLPMAHARVVARDLETGELSSYSFTRKNQRNMETKREARQQELRKIFQGFDLPYLSLTPTSNYAQELTHFFLRRHRRVSA